jgi:hypothetical protein
MRRQSSCPPSAPSGPCGRREDFRRRCHANLIRCGAKLDGAKFSVVQRVRVDADNKLARDDHVLGRRTAADRAHLSGAPARRRASRRRSRCARSTGLSLTASAWNLAIVKLGDGRRHRPEVMRYGRTRTRRSWRKLHLGVDAVTGRSWLRARPARRSIMPPKFLPLLDQVAMPVASFTADGAYDQGRVYIDVSQ